MGAENGSRARSGDDLIDTVVVQVAAGHVDPPLECTVGKVAHPGDGQGGSPAVMVPAPDVGPEHRAGTGAGDDLIHAVTVDVAAGHIDTPLQRSVSKEARSGDRHGGPAPVIVPAADVRPEYRAGTGAGDDLVTPVTVDVTAGHVDAEAVGAVRQEVDPGQGQAVGLPAADVGTIDLTGPGAGEHLVQAAAVQVAAGHVDSIPRRPVSQPLGLGCAHQGRAGGAGPGAGDQ